MMLRRGFVSVFPVMIAIYTVAVVFCIAQNGYFLTDDYQHFYKIATMSFWGYVLRPIDHHIGPLHRIITYAIYRLAPLNYSVAVLVLSAFHGLTLVALYQLLNLLHRSRMNWLLLFAYAVNIHWGDSLVWWCSGILRLPYILLTTLCIYQYLKYRETNERKHFWIALGLCVASFGFFSRSVLIPVYLVAFDICTSRDLSRTRLLKMCKTALPFFLMSILYVVVYEVCLPAKYPSVDGRPVMGFVGRSFSVLAHSTLALIYDPRNTLTNAVVLYCWIAFFVATVIAKPGALMLWAIGLGCVGLHYLLIAVSPVSLLGIEMAQSPRYHVDVAFIVVLFLCLIIRSTGWETIVGSFREPVGIMRCLRTLSVVLLIGCAGLSGLNQAKTIDTGFPFLPATKAYMTRLSAGLAELKANSPDPLAFVDGRVPGFMVIFCEYLAPYSSFLRIFGVEASYGVSTGKRYTIDQEGNVHEVEHRAADPNDLQKEL